MSDLVRRYAGIAAPRYTSYPTAAAFTPAVGPGERARWLAKLAPGEPVSVYLHVPYCRELCLYCGCTTKALRRESVLAGYRAALQAEIERAGLALQHAPRVTRVHWGGGTPSLLGAEGLAAVLDTLRRHVVLAPDLEHAIELDPRHVTPALARDLAGLGVTRVSLGVQDLDPEVQAAIGRLQPAEFVRDAVAALNAAGLSRLNLDLIYGLPRQTLASVVATARAVLRLAPDRIACYGYAHLPRRRRNQRLIDAATLPDAPARQAQADAVAAVLVEAGFIRVGLDHYARPEDPLARALRAGRLRRTFQGYTDDASAVLLGFGASAISRFDEGFVQNVADPTAYVSLVNDGVLPVARGIRLTDDDRDRGRVIERLMCDFAVDLGAAVGTFADELALLRPMVLDGLVALADGRLTVTEAGRPFVRLVAAVFDAARHDNLERFSAAV